MITADTIICLAFIAAGTIVAVTFIVQVGKNNRPPR